ncbi:MAG: hypothetical protein WBP11_06680 [Dokdonella sp.]
MSTFRPVLAVLSLAIGAVISGNASAQIYTNGPISTGATTESGVAAPAGTTWSELQHDVGNTTESNTTLGTSGNAGSFRLADDFVVPPGQNWTISAIETFAYKTGSAATPSPFVAATLRIWDGRPGDPGAAVLCGDTTTNVLASTTDSLIFRTGGTVVPLPATPGTTRKVWRNRLTVPAACAGAMFFTPGTYWVDYDTADSLAGAHFYPLVTVPGTRTPPGTPNARQFAVTGATWSDVIDLGNPATAPDIAQELPFLLFGTLPVSLQSFSVD